MELGFARPVRRHSRELSVVPILDMMTTLIVFLLQIISFMEYTKITLPPSSTSVITDPVKPPPLSPKLFLMTGPTSGSYRLQVSWSGETGGLAKRDVPAGDDPAKAPEELLAATRTVMSEFWKTHPTEKTLQVGLASGLSYQDMISLMDGIQDAYKTTVAMAAGDATSASTLADLVLLSYTEVDAEAGANRGQR